MSLGKPDDEPVGARVECAIEVALPFVDDFSQNAESGDTIELEVHPLFYFGFRPSPFTIVVYLPSRKFGEVNLYARVGARS